MMQRLRRTRLSLLVCLAIAGPTSLRAQQPVDTETPQERQLPGWVFTPSFGVGGAWDDNILLSTVGIPPLEDYASPLDPNVTLDYRGRRLRLTSGYGGSFLLYRQFDELNNSNQRLRVEVEHRATERLKVFGRENFILAPSTDALNLAGVPFTRIGSRMNEAGGGVEALVAPQTTLESSYILRVVAFDELLAQNLQDGHEHVWTLTLARAFSPRLTLGGSYELRREVLSDARDRFNIQTGGVTAEYRLTPTTSLTGLFGIARLGSGLTHDSRTGPYIRAEIDYRLRDAAMMAAYLRSFVPSFGFGGTYQNEEWTASIQVPISAVSRRLYVASSVAWYDNDPLLLAQPSLHSLWFSGTLGYRASRWMNLEGYGGRTQQDTQRPGGDLRRNEIGFRIVVSKPMRIR